MPLYEATRYAWKLKKSSTEGSKLRSFLPPGRVKSSVPSLLAAD